MQAKTGSPAFTIWPKETAPAVIAYTAPACATAAQKPSGASFSTCSNVIFGALRASGAAQRKMAYTEPTMS